MQLSQFLKTYRIFANTIVGEFFGSIWVDRSFVGQLATITYSAAPIPDVSLANDFVVTVTDGVAFVFGVPTNPPPAGFSQRISIKIRNASGGAHGAITWNAIYLTSVTPLTAIANGFSKTIDFIWDGTNWVEAGLTADVTN